MAEPTERDCGAVAEANYTISGTITSPDRADLRGLQIQIVDRVVGNSIHLVETLTDDCGKYRITFPARMVTDRGKQRPDVEVRVHAAGRLVATSEVRYNASSNETIDVELPANSTELRAEHAALTSALGTHYNGPLRALKENDTQHDITYLANKSGWDARAVAMAALADRFSANSVTQAGETIDASFYYALFRAGLAANEDTLFHADTETVRAIWTAAADQGVIPSERAGEIPAMIQRFKSLSADSFLSGAPVIGVSGINEMLEQAGLDEGTQAQFAELYVEHRNDMATFWEEVENNLGPETSRRLQVDGKLALLTINNGPLMAAVHDVAGGELTNLAELAETGYHRASQWSDLLQADVSVPDEIPGETDAAKRANYAEYLAANVRLSYPTAAMADMVASGTVPVDEPESVSGFLSAYQRTFQIGAQPVERFIAENNLSVEEGVVNEVKRIQRVYQITPSDEAMGVMLENGLDAASHVAQYDRDAFVATFGEQLGSTESAEKIYDRAVEVHNAVLNIAVSYLTASNGIALGSLQLGAAGASSPGTVVQPAPFGPGAPNVPGASSVIAYPTLESLFGEMDFCDCAHCRSILSPAAYLVDLLTFIDRTPPPGAPVGSTNPQTVLFDRRPDIQHLPLTCENTNTALPYIDVVNETLEYFITHTLSLTNYSGHDTGSMTSEDLLANPAFVNDAAYTILAGERFPINLPFHRPLESLRRHVEKFGVALPVAMEKLRQHDNLERGVATYGGRDIFMEELRLSRGEYQILTEFGTVGLEAMYGNPLGGVIATLSNAKKFCRHIGITYEELVALLRTRFINPNSDLLPKLERLGVSFSVMKQLKDGVINDAQFNALLPTGALAPDPAEYGGNIPAWVKDNTNYNRIMALITLTDVTLQADVCSFDLLEIRTARPMTSVSDTSTRLTAVEFTRFLRFIRLWKKLGWTIEQTDQAICALFRGDLTSFSTTDVDTTTKLDTGFLALLPRLGVLVRVMRMLDLTPKRDLQSVLALWSNIDTHGENALYRKMFLNPTILKQHPVYADNGYGAFLTGGVETIGNHVESLRAAFNLSGDEFKQIFDSLGYNSSTLLTIPAISAIFRRGYLSRVLRISVRELLLLITVTGLNPFDPVVISTTVVPAVPRLVDLVNELRENSLKVATALYLVWNHDLSGSSAPTSAQTNEFARALREDFRKIEKEFGATDDPDGEVARARMTIVYGQEATDFFFRLLDDRFIIEAPYAHFTSSFGSALASAVVTAGGVHGPSLEPRVAYDDFNRVLTFTGVIDIATRNALKAVVTLPAVVAEVPPAELTDFQNDFRAAVDALFDASDAIVGPFFARYDALRDIYMSLLPLTDPPGFRHAELLASFLPILISERKTQMALHRIAEAAQVDRLFAEALINASPASAGLHEAVDPTKPALNDLLSLEITGLTAQFNDDVILGPNPQLHVTAGGFSAIPANITSPGDPVSGIWTGYIEAPESGKYNFNIDAEVGSTVNLRIDGNAVTLMNTGINWRSASPLTLKGGTLYAFELIVESITSSLSVQWETLGHGRADIPMDALYPSDFMTRARDAYVRFLKGAALANTLKLNAAEVARPELTAVSWLNALPVDGTLVTPSTLFTPFQELLDYAAMKRALSPGSELLLTAVRALDAGTPDPAPLYALTGWDTASVATFMSHIGGVVADLEAPRLLRRAYDAFALAQRMGLTISALIAATTNEPTATTVRNLQAALRARYSTEDWRTVVQPINDQMRVLQRDALVAYILHKFRNTLGTQHIDTTEKLFEYFLMDVQMEPCMQTSRIRHALSSVQIFIDRCIMNLEPRVFAPSLSAKQWEWMKRYRVWEANRKVFLYPENWIEPELRDDKSPIFKELESELLQSDITEETAQIAMLNYLSQLEEVAMLEPCALYHIAADIPKRQGQIDHVVARTPGTSRKYYYRRREYGYWTPWEQIKLDIEDNPVVPVVWRDRLLLFWTRMIKTGPDKSTKPSGQQTLDSVQYNDPRMTVKTMLCWSEYYNGKWQPAKSSNVENPPVLTTFDVDSQWPFDRSRYNIEVHEEGDALRVTVGWAASFLFYNTHSEPLNDGWAAVCYWGQKERNFIGTNNDLTINYLGPGWNPDLTRDVLKATLPYRLVLTHHPVPDVWHPPFFYYDNRHVFYVSSVQESVPLELTVSFGIPIGTSGSGAIPGISTGTRSSGTGTLTWSSGGAAGMGAIAYDAGAAQAFVTEDANIHQAIGSTILVNYDGLQIGPGGATNQG